MLLFVIRSQVGFPERERLQNWSVYVCVRKVFRMILYTEQVQMRAGRIFLVVPILTKNGKSGNKASGLCPLDLLEKLWLFREKIMYYHRYLG